MPETPSNATATSDATEPGVAPGPNRENPTLSPEVAVYSYYFHDKPVAVQLTQPYAGIDAQLDDNRVPLRHACRGPNGEQLVLGQPTLGLVRDKSGAVSNQRVMQILFGRMKPSPDGTAIIMEMGTLPPGAKIEVRIPPSRIDYVTVVTEVPERRLVSEN